MVNYERIRLESMRGVVCREKQEIDPGKYEEATWFSIIAERITDKKLKEIEKKVRYGWNFNQVHKRKNTAE